MKMEKTTFKEKIIDFYQAKKRLVWIGAGVLLALIAAVVIFAPEKTNPLEENVQIVQVTRGSLTESIGEVGYVEAQPSAVLTWNSGGSVAEYDIKVGDQVSKDDVLMELEFSSWSNESLQAQSDLLAAELELENLVSSDSDFQNALQNVTDAEWTARDKKEDRDSWNYGGSTDFRVDAVRRNYMSAVQNVWVLEAEYEVLRVTLDKDDPDLIAAYDAYQASDLERDSLLRALNQILGHSYNQDVETDFIEYDQAKADLEQARAEYNRLVDNSQEISGAQANVQALKNTINKARIIAPFDGTVTEISYLPGEHADSGAVAVQVDDLSSLVVNVDVSEIDIAKVAVGQIVAITFDALPYSEYSGLVESISSAGTDANGTVEFRVMVSILDADESVKPGFTAVVSIITSDVKNALLVPTQALRGQNGNYMVMVVGENGTLNPVPVKIRASSDEYTEIVSGDILEGNQLLVMTDQGSGTFKGSGFGMMMGGGVGDGERKSPENK